MKDAWVAELADALDLGSSTERCEGSTPSSRIFKLDHVLVQHNISHLIPLPYNILPVILNNIIWLELVPGRLRSTTFSVRLAQVIPVPVSAT